MWFGLLSFWFYIGACMDYIKGANKIFTNERSWIKDNSVKMKRSKFELQIERLKDFVSTLQIFAKCE